MTTANKFTKISGINEPYASKILEDKEHAIYHIPSGSANYDAREELINEINAPEPPEQVAFTINVTPSDATVTINDQQVKTLNVDKGSEVRWSANKTGYVEQSGSETVNSETTKEITLDKQKFNVTITTTPAEATVKFNDGSVDEDKKIEVEYDGSVKYKVEAVGYDSKEETVSNIQEEKTIPVELTKTKCTLTITSSTPSAQIKINSEVKSSITVDYGTEVNYEVSAEGYDTKTGKITVNQVSQTENIDLTKTRCTLTINTTPTEATVKFDDGDVDPDKSIEVDYGTSVKYTVEAETYTSKSDTVVVNEKTKSVDVTLDLASQADAGGIDAEV